MDIALRILQVLPAVALLMAGVSHGFRREQAKAQIKWLEFGGFRRIRTFRGCAILKEHPVSQMNLVL